jgi:Cu(I)/Ag(I) efflux system membrane fusion protein
MHPEVREDGQTPCPLCGMNLVEVAVTEDGGRAKGGPSPDEIAHWTCPMHPSVMESAQTPCPLCNMDLTPVTHGELQGGAVVVDRLRRQRFGIKTHTAEKRALTLEISAPGTVRFDENRMHDVALRAEAWVDELYVVEAGTWVRKGTPLVRLYSTFMYNAQREFLAHRGSEMQVSKLERLKLLGMDDRQIDELRRRGEAKDVVDLPAPRSGVVVDFTAVQGSFLPLGSTLARIAQLDPVWVEAQVHESEVGLIARGMALSVRAPGLETPLEGKVLRVEPWVDPHTRRAVVRASVPNPETKLFAEMFVDTTARVPLEESLVVPAEAVMITGARRIVFVDEGDDRLVPREVRVGRSVDGWVQVLAGVEEGEAVVSSGTFLVAAESRIRAAESFWAPGNDGDP